jgi:hypothetical protein
MSLGKGIARGIVAKMGDDPEAMDEGPEAEPEEGDDKEADEAAERTAFHDFLSALGLNTKKADAAMSALKEFLSHCKYDEDSGE